MSQLNPHQVLNRGNLGKGKSKNQTLSKIIIKFTFIEMLLLFLQCCDTKLEHITIISVMAHAKSIAGENSTAERYIVSHRHKRCIPT